MRLAFRIAVNAFPLNRFLKVPPPREKSMWAEYNADSSDTAKGHCIRKPYLCCVTFGCARELGWIPADTQPAPVGGNRTESHRRDWWCKPANDTSLFSLFILLNAQRGRLRRQLLQTAQHSQLRIAECQCCDSSIEGNVSAILSIYQMLEMQQSPWHRILNILYPVLTHTHKHVQLLLLGIEPQW